MGLNVSGDHRIGQRHDREMKCSSDEIWLGSDQWYNKLTAL